MASRFQEAALVASPSYPNAAAWSQENLLAVGSGPLVTILNPALPSGPRGLITIPNCNNYPIGIVKKEDLLTGGLLPICLKRDRHPSVQSLSWSPLGLASNYGCLLAVCTTEGNVKLYRAPFCDFCAEWIEIVDVSDKLYEYLTSINFGVPDNSSSKLPKEQAVESGHVINDENLTLKAYKRRRVSRFKINGSNGSSRDLFSDSKNCDDANERLMITTVLDRQEVSEVEANNLVEHSRDIPKSKSQKKVLTRKPESDSSSMISADQYASRNAMLSSLVVAWSSLLRLSEVSSVALKGPSNCFSLLAIGAKSVLVGLLQAHGSWITALSCEFIGRESSNPQVLLVTGSFDGSVNLWVSVNHEVLTSSGNNLLEFSLLKKVIMVNHVPISTLSLIQPAQSPEGMLLAIGKGSGSFEIWTCDILKQQFNKIGSCSAHDQVVTGLAWAFDGRCLYSCSQDNYVRTWTVDGNAISEVSMPPNTPGLSSTSDLPHVFHSCLGVAMSPGNLVFSLVRSFNLDQLNQMYQARAQKAAVEFFWSGAHQCAPPSELLESNIIAFPGFSKEELACWDSNYLWCLKQYEDVHKPLVLWDIVAALLAFKRLIPEFVEYVVLKWLSISYLGSHIDIPVEEILLQITKAFSKVPSRCLHILNVISRRVMLAELKADQINSRLHSARSEDAEDEQLGPWLELLKGSERELRERLVGLSFSSSLTLGSCSTTASPQPGCWRPVGLAQMLKWVELNHDHVHNQLKALTSEIKSHLKSKASTDNAGQEKCCYCTAPVEFDSTETAFCKGSDSSKNEADEDGVHKLERCSVSMQVCPTTPSWFCKCCHRWTFILPPETLFTIPCFPSDIKSFQKPSLQKVLSIPFCPFCGILLQRLQPEFLLSPSPV